MPTTVTLSGWKEFEAKCRNMPKVLAEEFDGEAEEAARHWVSLAKNDAPIDMGFLRGQISKTKINGGWEVTSGANYSAYIEWGTKKHVSVPADLSSYASQFMGKGGGGDYYDFLNSILDWVKRKGFAQIKNSYTGRKRTSQKDLLLVAQTIAFFIMKNGIRPHPFFFIQSPIVHKQLIFNIQDILNRPH